MRQLQREVELAQSRYLALRQKQEEYRLARESQLSGVRIIAPARVTSETRPVRPRPAVEMVLGLTLGLLAGLLLALGMEHLDDTYPDLDAMEQDLQVSVLGVVPAVRRSDQRLTCFPGASSALVEATRSLLRNLRFSAQDQPLVSLLMTSSAPGEGKSTMALNLAVAAAEAGQRVVLVDADLRKPSIHRLAGLLGERGLVNVLAGQATLEECLATFAVDSSDGSLELLPAGPPPPNPPALFESSAMNRVLDQLRARADLVIIDAPPVGHFTDAQVLAAKVGAVMLVVDATRTRRELIRRAKRLLALAGGRLLGIVGNKAQQSGLVAHYGEYHESQRPL